MDARFYVKASNMQTSRFDKRQEAGDALPWHTDAGRAPEASARSNRLRRALYYLGIVLVTAVVFWHDSRSLDVALSPRLPVMGQDSDPQSLRSSGVGKMKKVRCEPSIRRPFSCYYLEAPLDHLDHHDHRRAYIAMVKYPAGAGHTPRSKVRGTIFFNPGGPGGSGVDFLTRPSRVVGGSMAQQFDELFKGQWDLMSFDPRGVGRTTPVADCLHNATSALVDDLLTQARALPSASNSSVPRELAHYRLTADLCASDPTSRDALRFVSTPSVARDMRLMHRAVGDKKLNYWGFSYGSVLGSVYAAMFPDQVGRLAVDGVVDVDNYLEGKWSDNLADTEGTLHGIFLECVKAGEERCPLAKLLSASGSVALDGGDDDQTVAAARELQARFQALLDKLREEPLAVADAAVPQVLTYALVKEAVFMQLYTPLGWPKLAEQLLPLMSGNGSAKAFTDAHGVAAPDTSGSCKGAPRRLRTKGGDEAQVAIAASDAPPNSARAGAGGLDSRGLYTLIDELGHDSAFAAEIWASVAASVAAWRIEAKERFPPGVGLRGDAGDPLSLRRIRTSNPIVFIGNDYDPVTPLRFARQMAARFEGSRVLHLEGAYGHCSLAHPSECAARKIRRFFNDGVLPGDDDYEEGRGRGGVHGVEVEVPLVLDRPPSAPGESVTVTVDETTCGVDASPYGVPVDDAAASSLEDGNVVGGEGAAHRKLAHAMTEYRQSHRFPL